MTLTGGGDRFLMRVDRLNWGRAAARISPICTAPITPQLDVTLVVHEYKKRNACFLPSPHNKDIHFHSFASSCQITQSKCH